MTPPRLQFRQASKEDLPEIVRLLAEDPFANGREEYRDPLPQAYRDAFDAIAADPNNMLFVAELDGKTVGTFQLTLIPNISFKGACRALIEAVMVDGRHRGTGIGGAMMRFAIQAAAERGCRMVQLTTNRMRPDTRRFYERLGFTASHEGMKLAL